VIDAASTDAQGEAGGPETAEPLAGIEAGAPQDAEPSTSAGSEGEDREGSRRRGRGRERNRRERRDEDVASAPVGEEAAAVESTPAAVAEAADTTPLMEARPAAVAAGEAVAMHAVAAPVEAPASKTAPAERPVAAMPAVQPFDLPLGDLQALAESAGLQWVNSDADKIRAVQEAMANEPAPVHVPRERKPMPVVDEGPLVLVETKKDLSQLKLPFEQGGAAR
jgi:ribonuclease E